MVVIKKKLYVYIDKQNYNIMKVNSRARCFIQKFQNNEVLDMICRCMFKKWPYILKEHGLCDWLTVQPIYRPPGHPGTESIFDIFLHLLKKLFRAIQQMLNFGLSVYQKHYHVPFSFYDVFGVFKSQIIHTDSN